VPSCPPPSSGSSLHELACALLACDLPRPFAVGVEHLGSEPELVLQPLTASSPVASLLGVRAPAHWSAFGIVACGDARPVSHGAVGDTSDHHTWSDPLARVAQGRAEVAVAYLVDRRGAQGGAVQVLDGTMPLGDPYDTGMLGGRIPDVCRRVLGVPTRPPSDPVDELWCVDWLDRVVEAVIGRDLGTAVPPWPVLRALWRGAPAVESPWAIVRRRVADGSLAVAGITPALAAWMDDGMFSREALAAYPERNELLVDLAELLPPRTMATLLATLAAPPAHEVA
jgi:hypothetical protein